jgi:hypothetical protein
MAPPQLMVLNEKTGMYEPVVNTPPAEDKMPANTAGQRAGLAAGGGLLLRLLWWYRKLKREGQL